VPTEGGGRGTELTTCQLEMDNDGMFEDRRGVRDYAGMSRRRTVQGGWGSCDRLSIHVDSGVFADEDRLGYECVRACSEQDA
jgi:hypothetical protein